MPKQKRKVFVLKASEWLNPNTTPGVRSLLWRNDQGKGCCLGICLIREGIDPGEIEGEDDPEGASYRLRMKPESARLPDHYRKAWLQSAAGSNTPLAYRAMAVNDAEHWGRLKELSITTDIPWPEGRVSTDPITLVERVELLRPIFREAGYELRFLANR